MRRRPPRIGLFLEPDLPRARVRPLSVRVALPRMREPGEAVWGLAVCGVSGEGGAAFSGEGGASRTAEKEARGGRGGGCRGWEGRVRYNGFRCNGVRFEGVPFDRGETDGGTAVQHIRRTAECRVRDGWLHMQGVGEGTE